MLGRARLHIVGVSPLSSISYAHLGGREDSHDGQ